MEKFNLLEQDAQLPCSRVVNGFRIFPLFTPRHKICFNIIPNNTRLMFSFCSLSNATDFALKFRNRHSDRFWFSQFYNFHSYCVTCNFLDAARYNFCDPLFFNPDCPYLPKN